MGLNIGIVVALSALSLVVIVHHAINGSFPRMFRFIIYNLSIHTIVTPIIPMFGIAIGAQSPWDPSPETIGYSLAAATLVYALALQMVTELYKEEFAESQRG